MSIKTDLNHIEMLTGVTYITLKKSIDENGIKSVGRDGKKILYDSKEILEALYRRQSSTVSSDVREMLIAEQHREKKRENDLAEGLIAPLSALEDALTQVGQQIVVNLEALPLEMKRANPRLTGHDIQTVKKNIARCCGAIADIHIEHVEN